MRRARMASICRPRNHARDTPKMRDPFDSRIAGRDRPHGKKQPCTPWAIDAIQQANAADPLLATRGKRTDNRYRRFNRNRSIKMIGW